MAINSREKGKRGEREVVKLLIAHGIPARRGVQYAGNPGAPDVVHALGPLVHFEVKRTSRLKLEDWYDQAIVDAKYRIPVVLHRLSSKSFSTKWRATLSLAHLMYFMHVEPDAIFECGSVNEVRSMLADLPLSTRVVRSNALRFDAELSGITGDHHHVLVHARREDDALWMASMWAESFLAHMLLPYAKAEYGFQPDHSPFDPDIEFQYNAFWEQRRDQLAVKMPLFAEAA